jgi:hypothetical protein
MPTCSPSARETERLLRLLDAYNRDELWLRTEQVYALAEQPGQVRFAVVDADGTEVADRSGVVRPHTLQVYAPAAKVVPGQVLQVRRDGTGVRVQILPVAPPFSCDDRSQGDPYADAFPPAAS